MMGRAPAHSLSSLSSQKHTIGQHVPLLMRKVIDQTSTFHTTNNQIMALHEIGRIVCSAAVEETLMQQGVIAASCQK